VTPEDWVVVVMALGMVAAIMFWGDADWWRRKPLSRDYVDRADREQGDERGPDRPLGDIPHR
jgi:hypothetical protein